MYSVRRSVILLFICCIQYTLGCYRITQNIPEHLHYVEFERVATNVNITSASSLIDCLGLENQLQKIHISWTPSKVLPEYFNVTIQSDDKDFFAKKTILGNETEAAFGVMITPTRKYNVSIEADARLTSITTFIIEKERPCIEINPYWWIGICTTVIVLSFILTYNCQVAYEIPEERNKDEKQANFYKKNLTEGNILTLDSLMVPTAEKKDNEDKKESDNDKLPSIPV